MQRVFGAGGVIDSFVSQRLDRLIDRDGPVWRWVRDDPLTAGLPARWDAFVGHKEAVQALPPGCVHLVAAEPCPFQMIRWGRNVYATQFHPEADARDFEQRIRIYRDHGYFPPETAEDLIATCHAASVTIPGEILRRFAERYG